MKKVFVAFIFLLAGVTAQYRAAAQYLKPGSRNADDIARYKVASSEARRKYFAAAMSNLTPEQLQVFWEVYPEYEKEKDAIAMARTDLAAKYWGVQQRRGSPGRRADPARPRGR
jgi:hypothetical protein